MCSYTRLFTKLNLFKMLLYVTFLTTKFSWSTVPYSAYQVKTVNYCQPIQAPLTYFIIIFMQAQEVVIFTWCEIWQNTHSNYEFKSVMVEYWKCDYYVEIVHCYPSNVSMCSILCRWGAIFSVSSAGIHLVE